jgi:starch phosphorylase
MTYLALEASRYVNGVARRHGEVSRRMFGEYEIDSITNGVHVATWTAPPMQALFDRHIAGWREDNDSLRYALSIPPAEVWSAHQTAKDALVDFVNQRSGAQLRAGTFTLGFARRVTAYKRPDLLFFDLARLLAIHAEAGSIQIVLAGKAPAGRRRQGADPRTPQDDAGCAGSRDRLPPQYDMAMAARLVGAPICG